MSKKIAELYDTEMDRKDFLKYCAFAVVTVAGIPAYINALSGLVSPQAASAEPLVDTTVTDNLFTIQNADDLTKQAQFIASGISSGNTRTYELPDIDTTLVGLNSLQDYPLLAGRSGGQTLYGGTDGADKLTLVANPISPTTVSIAANSGIRSFVSDQTFITKPSAILDLANTYTLNFASANWGGNTGGSKGLLNIGPKIQAQQNTASITAIGYKYALTLKNIAGSGTTFLGQAAAVRSTPTVTADTDSITAGATADYYSNPTFSTMNSGLLTMSSDFVNYETLLNLADTGVSFTGTYAAFGMLPPSGTGTIANMTGLRIGSSTKGTVTNYGVDIGFGGASWGGSGTNIGVRIVKPTGGTTNLGLQNYGATAFPQTSSTISSANSTIDISGTVVRLNNTSSSSITLNTGRLPSGKDGQIIVLYNSSTQNIVLTDGTTYNLRLTTSTFTLGTRDNIMLLYSSTIGDWIEISRSNII